MKRVIKEIKEKTKWVFINDVEKQYLIKTKLLSRKEDVKLK
jgi:hypothetical protein